MVDAITFREATPDDIPRCHAIEEASFPSDETDGLFSLKFRQEKAGQYFRCALLEDKVIGFVCATRYQAYTKESMTTHDPKGKVLAIHIVALEEPYRGRGIGRKMFQNYNAIIDSRKDGIETVALIAKSHRLGFYVRAGFSVLRPSDIVLGQELWYHLERPVATPLPCWIVDSFAVQAGKGNPAGVVLLPEPCLDVGWMKTVAIEFNLSETAFIWPLMEENKNNRYAIRFYTGGGAEVDLCGHATLASAAVVFGLPNKVDEVTFVANKDTLHASRGTNQSDDISPHKVMIAMEFPLKGQTQVSGETKEEVVSMLQAAFPASSASIADSVDYVGLDEDGGDLLIQMTTDVFHNLQYDGVNYDAIASYNGYNRGIMICAASDQEGIDFSSRFFGPKVGINEDPVTGSAHCVLAPYFSTKQNKPRVVGYQASKRGGIVECTVNESTVTITGPAIITVKGTLLI